MKITHGPILLGHAGCIFRLQDNLRGHESEISAHTELFSASLKLYGWLKHERGRAERAFLRPHDGYSASDPLLLAELRKKEIVCFSDIQECFSSRTVCQVRLRNCLQIFIALEVSFD